MAYRFVYPVNLEYTAESRFEAVNYKFVVDKIAELEETLDGKYALIDHTHDYSTTYAAIDHTHDYSDTYAAISHTHDYSDTYAAINHTHSGYALTDHNHDSAYSAINHDHDSSYSAINHNHDTTYSAIGHNHNSEYASINHTHNQFLVTTIDTVSGLSIILDRNKAMYKKSVGGDVTLAFDASNLTVAANEVMTFELLIEMGATAYTVTFPNTVTWLEGSAPTMTTVSKSYLMAFRSYDGGTSWIGSYQGSF